jgi:16S rRNA (cytosine967-C5)-methyltransferase
LSRAQQKPASPSAQRAAVDLPGLASRQCAMRLLGAVIDTRTPLDGLTDDSHGHVWYMALDTRDRHLVRAILTAALRHRLFLDELITARLQKPLPAGATALVHLLHVALAQIMLLDIPDSAAVNLAVEQAKSDPRLARFAALVNGILRSVIRDKAAITGPECVDLPDWFAKRLAKAYGPARRDAIAKVCATRAPIDLTIRSDSDHWAQQLGGMVLPNGTVRLDQPQGAVTSWPGFETGAWWVQDAAASLPAQLFGDLIGKHVVDLCAAPGGKTAQLANAGARVVALDKSSNRLKRLKANLDRLGLDVETVAGDALTWKPVALLDGALLDAPCSSTGTIRRHPDVLWTKTPDDIAKLANLQRRMLDHAVTLVKPGGVIIFSNCSLDPLEGEAMIAAFLAEHPGVTIDDPRPYLPELLHGFVDQANCVRTTPADFDFDRPEISGLDGFFAVRLLIK